MNVGEVLVGHTGSSIQTMAVCWGSQRWRGQKGAWEEVRGSQPCSRVREGLPPEAFPRGLYSQILCNGWILTCTRPWVKFMASLEEMEGRRKVQQRSRRPGTRGKGQTGPNPKSHPFLRLPLSSPCSYLTSPHREDHRFLAGRNGLTQAHFTYRVQEGGVGGRRTTSLRLLPPFAESANSLSSQDSHCHTCPVFPEMVWSRR